MAYLNNVETNPKQAMVIHDNQINYPKPRGIARINDNNNSDPVRFYNNKICIEGVVRIGDVPLIDLDALVFFQTGYWFDNNTISCPN
jgi:hypothetical protein